jgi:hypothetical protein
MNPLDYEPKNPRPGVIAWLRLLWPWAILVPLAGWLVYTTCYPTLY